MGGVRLLSHDFHRFLEVASICTEVKHVAKSIPGSVLFMDRRGQALEDPLAVLDIPAESLVPGP